MTASLQSVGWLGLQAKISQSQRVLINRLPVQRTPSTQAICGELGQQMGVLLVDGTLKVRGRGQAERAAVISAAYLWYPNLAPDHPAVMAGAGRKGTMRALSYPFVRAFPTHTLEACVAGAKDTGTP